MTIEGRPFFANPDKTYEKQRQDRMQDAIDDYLTDDKVSARQTYEAGSYNHLTLPTTHPL